MSTNNTPHVGDVGHPFVITADSQDFSAATGKALKIVGPDGGHMTWTPTLLTSTSLTYSTVAGDLYMPGVYSGQLYLALPDVGWVGHGERFEFKVEPVVF